MESIHEVDGGGWRWMEVDGGGWRWMEVDGGGWRWMEVDGGGWRWMEVDGGGWRAYMRWMDRPRNSFFWVVAKFCYQVQNLVAKLILW